MRKRLLAIIATAAMVVAMVPSMVFADETVATAADLKSAMTTTGTVTLNANIEVPAAGGLLTVPNGADVVLNLNGNDITAASGRGYIISIESGGSLTINGSGKIENTNSSGYAILNNGSLVVNGGTIIGDYALYNGGYTNANATATLNGGTFKNNGKGYYSIANCSKMTIAGATVENWLSTSGKFEMTTGSIENFLAVSADKTVASGISTEIKGGTIDYLGVTTYSSSVTPNPVTISGGEIAELDVTADQSVAGDKKNTVTISGGVIKTGVEEDFLVGDLEWDEETGKVIDPNAPTTGGQGTAIPEKSPNTGDNSMAPIAVAGLVMAAMAAVVATRRRTN